MHSADREAFTVSEWRERRNVSRGTFYNEVKRKRLRAVKVGAKTMVLRADDEAWAESLPALELTVTA